MRQTWLPMAAGLGVLVALARMPYGYFMLLRLGLCVACLYYISQVRPPLAPWHRLALGALAVLYNPLLPIHLGSKSLWTMVNLATVAYFWFIDSKGSGRSPNEGGGGQSC